MNDKVKKEGYAGIPAATVRRAETLVAKRSQTPRRTFRQELLKMRGKEI